MWWYAVVQCGGWSGEVLHAEIVFPRVDADEYETGQPGEDDKEVGQICCKTRQVTESQAYGDAEENEEERKGHQRPVKRYEAA